ncbi:hypothetical protein ACLI1A_14500 [Flavobacterium sp. RHBU_3]|uniref:hypothetical protein n=1 Tax=Flavobacterium sp. RHBU_3 TaxID=3391184 RepID=UPI003984C403
MKNFCIVISYIVLLVSCKSKQIDTVSSSPLADDGYPRKSENSNVDVAIRQGSSVQKKEDSVAKINQWKILKNGFLWVNNKGELGFISSYRVNEFSSADTYLTHFTNENISLQSVIDTSSFMQVKKLSSNRTLFRGAYFKDKKNVYHFSKNYNDKPDTFTIQKEADQATFEVLSNCYARDKNYVYDLHNGRMDSIDPKKFKVIVYKEQCIGKFNNTYYYNGHIMSLQMRNGEEMQEIIKQFDKL